MELVVQEMWNICRFCLSQEEDILTPITSILDDEVTVENIQQLTGIVVEPDANIQHAVCVYCTDRLQGFVAFRRSCLENDAYLREIHPQGAAQEGSDAADLYSSDRSNQSSPISKSNSSRVTRARPSKQDKVATPEPVPIESNPPAVPLDDEVVDEQYSANYIAPGEDLDDEESDSDDVADSFLAERVQKWRETVKQTKIEQEHISKEMYHLLDLSKYERQQQLCELCGKQVSKIAPHMLSHTQQMGFACPHCPTRMKHQANMARHIKAVHERRVVKTCKLCDKGFTHKNGYISHMLSQHGIGEKQRCRICGQEFNHKSSVREHIKRYHNVQCYSCSLCDKTFTMRRALKIHQLVHSTEKPHQCPFCPKQFKSSKSRSTHINIHKGVLFKCTLCDKSYRYKSQLHLHRRKMHPTECVDSQPGHSDDPNRTWFEIIS